MRVQGYTPAPIIVTWYSHASVRFNILSGMAQLGAATGGVLEGTYRLPVSANWDMQFFIGLRSTASGAAVTSSDDIISVVINGVDVGVYKTPSCKIKVLRCPDCTTTVPVFSMVLSTTLSAPKCKISSCFYVCFGRSGPRFFRTILLVEGAQSP